MQQKSPMCSLKAAFKMPQSDHCVSKIPFKSLILKQLFDFACAIVLPRKFKKKKKIENETYFDNFQTSSNV